MAGSFSCELVRKARLQGKPVREDAIQLAGWQQNQEKHEVQMKRNNQYSHGHTRKDQYQMIRLNDEIYMC